MLFLELSSIYASFGIGNIQKGWIKTINRIYGGIISHFVSPYLDPSLETSLNSVVMI